MLTALAAAPATAAAQRNPCSPLHPMVDAIRFQGNHAISSGDLASIIATVRSSIWRRWFGWNIGDKACVDSTNLPVDAFRVSDLYRQRGFPGTVVVAAMARHDDRRARVTFRVKESTPLRVDSVTIDSLPENAANADRLRKFFRGWILDDSVFTSTVDSIQTMVRAAGYAHAGAPDSTVVRDTVNRRASISVTFHPGHMAYIGKITISVDSGLRKPALDDAQIRPLLSVKPGDRYTSRRIGQSQRDLYELELYRTVRIDADTAPHDTSDTIPLRVRLVEGDRRRLRVGAGWGTLDCFRTQTRIVDENILGGGNRLELNGRLSKIGIAQPFTGLSDLCAPRVRSDPYSQNLNYYGGATLNLRGIPGAIYKPTVTVYSSRISQVGAYEQTTDIGVVTSVTRTLAPRLIATAQYQFTNSHTTADGAVSCTTFGICRFEDLTAFQHPSPLHSVGIGLAKNPLSPTDDPSNGQRWQGDIREEYTIIAHTTALFFTRMSAEAAMYRPIGDFLVVAIHGQAGYIAAANDQAFLIPPAERFYGGGQSSVRGYDENLLGPGSYIVSQTQYKDSTRADGSHIGIAQTAAGYSRIAPSGGNAMWLANVEFRTRHGWPAEVLRWVFFVDAGRVWNTNDAFNVTNASPRVTPGIGIRLVTPIGPFRVDVGYNPYPFEAGPAYFLQAADVPAGVVGRAICVSPGSTDPLTLPAGGVGAASCPATYQPLPLRGLLSHLSFHFSIGQAF